MSDKGDILWRLYQEHCTWERHHEQQRSLSTNLLLAVAAAILGVVTFDKQLNNTYRPPTYNFLNYARRFWRDIFGENI